MEYEEHVFFFKNSLYKKEKHSFEYYFEGCFSLGLEFIKNLKDNFIFIDYDKDTDLITIVTDHFRKETSFLYCEEEKFIFLKYVKYIPKYLRSINEQILK